MEDTMSRTLRAPSTRTPRHRPVLAVTLLVLLPLSGSCGPTDTGDAGEPSEPLPPTARATKVENAVWSACSTAIVRGLSEQLVAEVECLRPGTITSIEGLPGVVNSDVVLPYLQAGAAEALEEAASTGGTIYVNSAIRSLAQQYLLYSWYRNGRCGIGLAAQPGRSNHESGLAVDVDNYSGRITALEGAGYDWLGSGDPVHFDYAGGGTDVRSLSVLAFQRLWNRNHPEDPIAEDGSYGNQTASRLAKTPVNGFDAGASCATPLQPEVDLVAVEVYWVRNADGSYQLRALAPPVVRSVEYYVDGLLIDTSSLAEGASFPGAYTFIHEGTERPLEVHGFDDAGQQVGLGVGLMDVTSGTAVYIKQMGEHLYEIGLERADPGVAAIEVTVDGQYLLTDSASGQTRSTRLAVRSYLNQLGSRAFAITTYGANGSVRGTLRRTFTVR
jgi:hypothetical protein